MADDLTLNAGSGGSTLATDQVAGGQHYQRVKLTDGTADSTTHILAGGGVEAAALRVTIASDSTGVLSVDDNGGALTVDGSVTVTQATAANLNAVVQINDGTDTALVTAGGALNVIANANSGVDIGDVDVLSVVPGTGATNLGKAEDAGHSSGDTGVMMLAVRQDTQAALAGTDGDYIPLTTNALGGLRTVITDVTGADMDLFKDSDNFAIGADHGLAALTRDDGTPSQYHFLRSRDSDEALYVADANAITALQIIDDWDESDRAKVNLIVGQAGIAAGTGVDGATVPRVTLATNVALPAGTNAIGKLVANSGVDIGDVDVTSIVPGTAATNLGKAEDAAHSSGDTGVYVLAVRDDALAAHSGTDGDYESLHTDAVGALWTRPKPRDIDVTLHTYYTKKYYTNAGAVTDGIVWSPAGGTRWHVVNLFVNVSAAATVTFEDDKAGGDEAVMKMELAANSGVMIPFGSEYPLCSGEDAADLLVTTTAGNVYITVTGYEL